MEYKFENYLLRDGCTLLCAGKNIPLPPKELAVLSVLVRNAGEIVTKDQLIDEVWYGGIVSDESLTRCIYTLRRCLGEDKTIRYIDTVYGKGYRFTAKVEAVESSPEKRKNPETGIKIALFPFEMADMMASRSLHHYLLDRLFFLKMVSDTQLDIISSLASRHFYDHSGSMQLINNMNVDYYISGTEISGHKDTFLSLELVRAKDHTILQRKNLRFQKACPEEFWLQCQYIYAVLSDIHPEIKEMPRCQSEFNQLFLRECA
ncbi:winged helix-turn-helix domain-containing protein [Yokenella regensburgei]|uniref:winged helix-turn-helix domain-containing protein n=1 Tax=Yokenella regensburgei TaxID=158877 RepID=UPI003ED91536